MQLCINGGQGEYPLASSFAAIFSIGKMASKCESVMTHSVLGILLANRFRFVGSDCHSTGTRVVPVSLAVSVFYVPIITESYMDGKEN